LRSHDVNDDEIEDISTEAIIEIYYTLRQK